MYWRRELPGWLYKPLPYLYMGAGIVVAITLNNVLGIASGLMLFLAGLMVWRTRFTYNSAAHQTAAMHAQGTVVSPSSGDSELAKLVWSKEYECGHAVIDAQHRRLFEIGNAFRQAILEKKSKLDVELLLEELIDDVAKHFVVEEEVLAHSRVTLSSEHQEAHGELLARCKDMAERYHNDEIAVRDLFFFVAQDVVVGHVLAEDLKYLMVLN
jgi:hemerythrin-like metal-binding protein